jgi:hypothetical protein
MGKMDYPPKGEDEVGVMEAPVETKPVVENTVSVKTPEEKQEVIKQTEEKIEEKKGFLKKLFGKKEELTPEARMAKWTPKHKAAIEFLSNINDKWAKSFEKMGDAQVDKVEEFVKNPANLNFTSVYYDESENKYKAKGGIATAGL